MQYEWTFNIDEGTDEVEAEEHELKMDSGTIVRMEIFNPPGAQRLCRSRICEELSVLWPGNPTGYLATDGAAVIWTEHYTLKSPHHRLILRVWNIDDTHPHDVVVRINVLPTAIAAPYLIIKDLVNVLKHLVGL